MVRTNRRAIAVFAAVVGVAALCGHAPVAQASSEVFAFTCVQNTQDPIGCALRNGVFPRYQWFDGGSWHFFDLGIPPDFEDNGTNADMCVDHGNGPDHNFVAMLVLVGNPLKDWIEYRGWSPGGGWGPWFSAASAASVPGAQPIKSMTCVMNPITNSQNVYVVDANGVVWTTLTTNESNKFSWTNWFQPFGGSGYNSMTCVSNTQDPIGCTLLQTFGVPSYQWFDGANWHNVILTGEPFGTSGDTRANICVNHGNGPDHNFVSVLMNDTTNPQSVEPWYTGWSPGGGWGPWLRVQTLASPVPTPANALTCVINPITDSQNVYTVGHDGVVWTSNTLNESNSLSWSNWFSPF